MTVYRLQPDSDHFHNLALVDESASPIYDRFEGTPFGKEWTPLEVTAADEDDELALLGDHALLGTIPVFSERAAVALSDVLRTNGELLPLVYSRRPYFAYNVTTVVNALDEQHSKVNRFSSGQVMSVDQYVFRSEYLDGRTIFKIPQLPRAFVFVTQEFADQVEAARLSGFEFHAIWSEGAAV